MASSSSSSSSPRNWRYNVFTSFHGPDVRKTFLSHLRKQFSYNGISMFDDQGIERSQVIAPALTQAIRYSRISMVVLSKNYASSSWCLDELVEILKCREDIGQIVMTIFYGVDPSDVRKQSGEFGIVLDETCCHKTEEERQRWSQALSEAGNIAGEHLLNWDNEAEMIEKIAKDVLDKLNVTPSRDFDGMVGLEPHLLQMESLLDLDYDGVKVVAISGPAGIGKTTIARALQTQLSDKFQLTCFVDNLRGNYHNGSDTHGYKLRLQEQFLSEVLKHKGLRICHLGAVKQNLCDQKCLIILDDVTNLYQLEALANETTWFGPGSRIVVTTENRELLQQNGIDNVYHVRFPSREEASEILCSYAFRQSSPRYGFHKFFGRITDLCNNLPLALRVVGLSLCGKKEDEWKDMVNRLETILDREIEDVLKVGYESLDENEQTLFLHIAVFFNHEESDRVKAMFADGNVDVKRGLKILLDWRGYPSKCLPPIFHPEYLVEFCMQSSQLEYLWQGNRKLTNLKKMDMSRSFHLKELPDLSNATNLEELDLNYCESLVEIPSSFSHLQNLQKLTIKECINLQVIPLHLKLASLEVIDMKGCFKLKKFSFISTNLRDVNISYTEEVSN